MEMRLLRPLAQAVALSLAASAAHAATITVNDGGDAGTESSCTLRQAILSANLDVANSSACVAGSGTDTIVFSAGLANATIALGGSGLLISSSVTISGSGQVIDAGGTSRVMEILADSPIAVNLSNLTLTGGTYYGESGGGGGLYISYGYDYNGQARTRHKAPRSNKPHAPTAPPGPAVTLQQVSIVNNKAGASAGGVYVYAASLVMDRSTISGNTLASSRSYQTAGGGIAANAGNYDSNVTITNSTISGNHATADGNDVYVGAAGGFKYGTVSITNTTISGNDAGGSNVHRIGGLALIANQAVIADSTISGNSAGSANVIATGVLVGSSAFQPDYGSQLTLNNSILSGNGAAGAAQLGTVNSANVIARAGLLGTSMQATYSGNGNRFSDAPALGALANNGGPTLTLLPTLASPAVGGGDPSLLPQGLVNDQRGAGFPRVDNGRLDIGAVQVVMAAAATPTPTPALSTWALGLLGGLLALFGLRKRDASG